MQFPYGIADFYKIISEGYFYVDRTDRIGQVEAAGSQLLLLRPRRFGKSLWLSTLENYYDLAKADDFTRLFGHLKIGANPTPRHNRYFVMKWNFSLVEPQGDAKAIRDALHRHINVQIQGFSRKYKAYLADYLVINEQDALSSFQALLALISQTPYKLYLLIDEYDNFANEVLVSHQQGELRYQELVGGEGSIKTLFKAVKDAAEGRGLDRVFMTGVSPVVLADITSGYNVVKNISLHRDYADLCGFHEAEICAVLTQLETPAKQAETLALMRTFYNGYHFGCDAGGGLIYNPTLALYFFEHLAQTGGYPQKMLDNNLAMDRNRIRYVAELQHGQPLVAEALHQETPIAIVELADRFGLEELLQTPHDHAFLVSLLYYFGVLTCAGRDDFGKLLLRVPNLVVRKLYIEQMQALLFSGYELTEQRLAVAEQVYAYGQLDGVCDFIEQHYFKALDNRDLRWANELVVKTVFLTVLFNDIVYITDSETALERRYADLSLMIRPDCRHYKLLDHVLEFKYLSLSALGLTAETALQTSRAELLALPLVADKISEAQGQLVHDRTILQQAYREKLRLRTHAVVSLGLTRLVWA